MKVRKCPYCGYGRMTRSPSGEHLLCLGCQRILVVPKAKDGRKHEETEVEVNFSSQETPPDLTEKES